VHHWTKRQSAILRIFTLLSLIGVASSIYGQQHGNMDVGLRIGCTPHIFMDVQPSDAAAATQIWAEELKRRKGFTGPTVTRVYEDLDSIRSDLKDGQIDLLITLTSEYLELSREVIIEPYFVSQKAGRVNEESLLLAHRSSGLDSLEQLRGKHVILMLNARSSLGRTWLETEIQERGYSGLKRFFNKVSSAGKYSRTILPVFFGQADACLVHRQGFDIMTELNPQIGKQLQTVASSPAFLPAILSIRPDYEATSKKALIESLGNLHLEPRGHQILTMFKVDRLVPFQHSYLNSARDLLKRNAELQHEWEEQ
jgi:phosphonate transport system substrate-binding protein